MHLLHGICHIQNLVIAGRPPVQGLWCLLVDLEMSLGGQSLFKPQMGRSLVATSELIS